MKKLGKLYEGKAKVLYKTDDDDILIQHFKDDATAFNAEKKGTIHDKGIVNNKISEYLFKYLEAKGVKSHFIERINDREMAVKNLEIIMVEVIVRNIVAGSMAKRMGVEEGMELKETIVELCYKSDELGDPFINEYVVRAFGLATQEELDVMTNTALKVNELLVEFFDERGIMLVDFKLEFGRYKGEVLLADEITPDGCRFWDKVTKKKLDKDRFRRDLGDIEEAYDEILKKVTE